jgi:hypothetical protein
VEVLVKPESKMAMRDVKPSPNPWQKLESQVNRIFSARNFRSMHFSDFALKNASLASS